MRGPAGAVMCETRDLDICAWSQPKQCRHCDVMRELVVEGGWVQKRMYDIGWSNEKICRGCDKEEGKEKHRPSSVEGRRNQIPEKLGRWEQRARTSKEDWKWQRGITSHAVGGVATLTVRRWESGKTLEAGACQSKDSGNHVTTDGSLLGVSGRRSACGWCAA